MAVLATATFTWTDAEGKTYHSSYSARDNVPSDGEVQALAADAQAMSALSLTKAVVSREVDITGQSDAAEAGSSRQRDASLVYVLSSLRASINRRYTFTLPQFKAALLDAEGRIDVTDAVFDAWRENFDDGAGIAAVVGDWFAGNQGELVEDQEAEEGFQNKN
jgi:hypothetical protein